MGSGGASKAKQEAALFGEAAVNSGRALPVQKTDEHLGTTPSEKVLKPPLINRTETHSAPFIPLHPIFTRESQICERIRLNADGRKFLRNDSGQKSTAEHESISNAAEASRPV
ncbi:hypothetical protein EYF80_020531 [Liparis tanakae]|uniref:Uncharacterized protein n=1 Tax=Liparis tanakae TaxID=230148 RepID=A0A4Z2HW23_9TELE|nr:hypothetical protein EYF80_020531 [Liparis tanakae]